MSRRYTSKQAEISVLFRSRRRCAFCFGLNGDSTVKTGQIAHIDQDPANGALDNLVFLCLEHHDAYDSRTSQSKGLTAGELVQYREELDRFVETAVREEPQPGRVPLELEVEALRFSTSPHRLQSVVRLLYEGPRSLEAINRHIPPCDVEVTRLVVTDVIEQGWAQKLDEDLYAITDWARNILEGLNSIPEAALEDAWRDVWG